MDDEETKRERLTRLAQMLFAKQWHNITPDEQKVLGLEPEDLPFIFITIDQIKNKVCWLSVNETVNKFYGKIKTIF